MVANNSPLKVTFTAQQGQLTKEIMHLLEQQHYQPRVNDDGFANDVFTNYLTLLDPLKSYLSQTDLAPYQYL
ncbi:MAG TPA: hypothetical protein EYQ12_08835, partial [Oceanospirillaceae bacterium]|nr:hypothetical protein [Oceanospirillaceae bacterium]